MANKNAGSAIVEGASKLTPWGAALDFGGDVLGAITSWYAVGEQRKENALARKKQDEYFYANQATEKTQANRSYGLELRKAALDERSALSAERLGKVQAGIANRQMAVTEKSTEADIALKQHEQAIAERTAKFNQGMTMIGNMTAFFNSPSTRGQYANLWKGYGG
jgi:hypothetical protein